MIRSAILLARNSLLSILFLTAALFTLGNIVWEDNPGLTGGAADAFPSLAPLPGAPKSDRAHAASLHSALFDPERRVETISGSIDDLKPGADTPASQTAIAIAGVLVDGSTRKAMLTVGGAAPVWTPVGGDAGGWRVASIDAAGAVVERNGASLSLKIADRYQNRAKPPSDAPLQPSDPMPGDQPPEPGQPPDGASPTPGQP